MSLKITTNNVPRDLIADFELTAKEREDFDYLDWAAMDEGRDSATFFRYKGELYDLGQFTRAEATPGWDGIMPVSWSFAYVVRFAGEDSDQVVVGTAMERS